MPILVGLVGIAVAVYFFVIRARNAANIADDVLDMANDVRLAARRFGFRRQTNVHPAESIEDPKIAIATIASAFIELDDLPTQEHRRALEVQLRAQLRVTEAEVEELTVLGRWMVSQCGGAAAAIARVSRKLQKLQGVSAVEPLMIILQNSAGATGNDLSLRQKEALEDIKRAFRLG